MSSSSRPPVSSRPQLTSLMYSLPVRRLKEILNHVLPDSTLGTVESISSPQLSRLYDLTMSDDRKLLLSFAPSLAVRLLRHEATLLSSEAILIHFISQDSGKVEATSISSHETPIPSLLFGVTPKLIKHSSNNREMAYPYSIFEPTPGAPLSTQSIYLSIPERRNVDRQIGLLARSLASLTSPSGTFGLVNRVLPDPFAPKNARPQNTLASASWAHGFNTLLEGILRDGEDMNVLVPYETIRAHYRRLSWCMDGVTVPRLVVLDIGADTNVMVERQNPQQPSPDAEVPRLTGLRSWSQGLFGDPLVASCFDEPTAGFLEGWEQGGEDVIEDQEGVHMRTMLYRCYHAVVMIVTEFYRPQADSSRRELEGRRKLTSALAELAKLDAADSEALKRVRSAGEETENSKRPKLEDD